MQTLAEGYRGFRTVIRLNGDALVTACLVAAALAAGAFLGSILQPL